MKIRSFLHSDIGNLKERNYELEQKLNGVQSAFDQSNNLWLSKPV